MANLHLSPVAPGAKLHRPRAACPLRTCSARVFASTRENVPLAAVNGGERRTGLQALPPTLLSASLMLATSAMLLAAPLPAQARLDLPNKEVDDTTSPLVQKLLKRSVENKEQYDKERLQDYYRRNFREYFMFEASSPKVAAARGISPESQQAIAKWLEENK